MYVTGLESPGWYRIDYKSQRPGPHRASARYIRPAPSQIRGVRHSPEIGVRLFYVIDGGEDTIAGVSYRSRTSFDVVSYDADTVAVIARGGNVTSLKRAEHPKMVLASVLWDHANDIPTGRDAPDAIVSRYYHFVTVMMSRPWFFVLLLILVAWTGFALLNFDAESRVLMFFFLALVVIVFLMGAYVGRGYLRYLGAYENAQSYLAPYRHDEHLLPMPYSYLVPEVPGKVAAGLVLYPLFQLLWVPLFLLLHVYFIVALPRIFLFRRSSASPTRPHVVATETAILGNAGLPIGFSASDESGGSGEEWTSSSRATESIADAGGITSIASSERPKPALPISQKDALHESKLYRKTGWLSEEEAGRIDQKGRLYEKTGWLAEEEVGRIDDKGRVYEKTGWRTEEEKQRIDEDGRIYKKTGWLSEEQVGRIDQDGRVYKKTGWFSEEEVGRVEKKTEKSGCFLSSACTEARALPDDCEELTILRRFRDEYVAVLPEGHDLLAHYARVAPAIVTRICELPERREIFEDIYSQLVAVAIELIEKGKRESALDLYRCYVLRLQERFCGASICKEEANPTFRA